MNKKYLGRAIILCLFIFLILLALLTEVNCKPKSKAPTIPYVPEEDPQTMICMSMDSLRLSIGD